jgi:hypothetical protein
MKVLGSYVVDDSRTQVCDGEISPIAYEIESIKSSGISIDVGCDFGSGGSGKNFFSIFDFFHM